jgi:hypothetical protein
MTPRQSGAQFLCSVFSLAWAALKRCRDCARRPSAGGRGAGNLNTVDLQVRSGLKNKAGNGQITKVESITKRGTIVAYEALLRTAGRHSEIQVGPDGQPLDHEE